MPDCARYSYERRPTVGDVVAQNHAVWRIVEVRDIRFDDDDQQKHREWQPWPGPPIPANEWRLRPFAVSAEWVGGVMPAWVSDGQKVGAYAVRARHHVSWYVYPGGRWPQCSCCGEPMPCRASITDAQVAVEVAKFEAAAAILPGSCWGCGKPVTSRQRSVSYPGENLDLPGGPSVRFHAAKDCRWKAERYEARWLKVNPGRARRLTWPYCRGHLFWHADGTSECVGGRPGCEGHHTHNHGIQSGCRNMDHGCPRGCDPKDSYCNPKRWQRPWLRPDDLPQDGDTRGSDHGLLLADDTTDDGRPTCPGVLIVHKDGTKVCVRGGRDDCWDGTRYRHSSERQCDEQTHGCPTCETTEGLA